MEEQQQQQQQQQQQPAGPKQPVIVRPPISSEEEEFHQAQVVTRPHAHIRAGEKAQHLNQQQLQQHYQAAAEHDYQRQQQHNSQHPNPQILPPPRTGHPDLNHDHKDISTELIQKYLDENQNLILAILENQNVGRLAECARYQNRLQQNLMYLASIADES